MESVTSINVAEVVSDRRIRMNELDKRRFGYFVFGGALVGAFLGLLWSASGNALLGLAGGAIAGTFIGWFAAAYFLEKGTGKKEEKKK
jgi:uncharacterized membrane protein